MMRDNLKKECWNSADSYKPDSGEDILDVFGNKYESLNDDWKWFTRREPQRVGDCTMLSMSVVLRTNGVGTFEARTRSKDTNDTWTIDIFGEDGAGGTVFIIGRFVMKMKKKNEDYVWRFDFSYDANAHYERTVKITWHNFC